MKKLHYILLLFVFQFGIAQNNDARIQSIKNQLEVLAMDNVGLTEQVKTEISVSNITLSNFLLAVSNVHKVNMNLAPELDQISIVNNFSNVTVADLLVFLCKEYGLAIDFTGNILSIKKYAPPIELPKERIIPISYAPDGNTISIDAKNDKLYDVFKGIIDESGKNLVFAPGMESKLITSYIQDVPFDAAMDKLALANQMFVEKTKDHFYVFEDSTPSTDSHGKQLSGRKKSNLNFKVLDVDRKLLEVDFVNTPIADIINDIGTELDIDIFTATPLQSAGNATFKTKSIYFDDLLEKLFESQSTSGTSVPLDVNANQNRNNQNQNISSSSPSSAQLFTFKKEGTTYFFGTENQLSVRKVEIIPLISRTVEMFADPSGGGGTNRSVGRNYGNQNSYGNSGYNNNYTNQFDTNVGTNRNNRESISSNNQSSFNNSVSKGEALLSILPDQIKQDLDIKVDYELNSFYVLGASEKIERFKAFIKKIDKPVPVILIEVMLIEVNRNSTIETGVSWGIGDEPAETKGGIYPQTDLTLGARTINRVLNGFDGFGHINLGKVVPNFFATIKAMESNGNIKIRSTPKLSTLNGHRATFSNGQTSYYAVTQRNIYGTDNPQTSEITNYEPIDAELGLTIKPMVSGDGQVTLDIFVVQSSFGLRIAEDAPPDLNSREFSSIIRVQDQDIVVLGGLEEQVKNDSGTGVPFLARIPVIKWLFSTRKREDSKSRLTVLIKPTVIY
ncbi:Type II secretion system protein D precursor [Mariniflexile rhizosphaerae]|uniref:type II secretion system protein GspD n=1 Tax=unclassified Mariniflexile TaxID=2643887 RepID=UPI000CAC92BD|nr:type II and III secretion system protein [Mariniflexile sp. TRM1-10]AXP80814.1 Type II secretion system protein D precursor [Mariniflexile sp. TRM1-10]PLB17654.1 MAG: Type IV pilus biogenesis protein PilQ [Flavobacteriaceae bacterium FS1-H7996/R]